MGSGSGGQANNVRRPALPNIPGRRLGMATPGPLLYLYRDPNVEVAHQGNCDLAGTPTPNAAPPPDKVLGKRRAAADGEDGSGFRPPKKAKRRYTRQEDSAPGRSVHRKRGLARDVPGVYPERPATHAEQPPSSTSTGGPVSSRTRPRPSSSSAAEEPSTPPTKPSKEALGKRRATNDDEHDEKDDGRGDKDEGG